MTNHAQASWISASLHCHDHVQNVQVPLAAQLNPDHPIDLHAATVAEVAAEEPANNLRKLLESLSYMFLLLHDVRQNGKGVNHAWCMQCTLLLMMLHNVALHFQQCHKLWCAATVLQSVQRV